MQRRSFLGSVAAFPALLTAQQGPPRPEPVEQQVAGAGPVIHLNHLGFLPQSGHKILVVRDAGAPAPREFTVRDVGFTPFHLTAPLRAQASDFGPVWLGDFSDLTRPGMYQVTVGSERSVPFFIGEEVWRKTLPKAVGYYRFQRCGVAVPLVHPACHLDDAVRRDTGEHVDEVGGWHDAGDLRKWMDVTMLNAIVLLRLIDDRPTPRPGEPTHAALLDEVRYGNRYFLKMQDRDGRVWHDTAGGVNGDNSDNRWTDNLVGTADDRHINVSKPEGTCAEFALLQALVARHYRDSDPAYAANSLAAARRAWNASHHGGGTTDLAWWAQAAGELFRVTGEAAFRQEALRIADLILSRQAARFLFGQQDLRGFWLTAGADDSHAQPLVDIVNSAQPALALLRLATLFPDAAARPRWLAAVALYLDAYVRPQCARNAYAILPAGLYRGAPSPEHYRSLAGELTYRYFLPTRKQFWWQGGNCHLAAHAELLGRAAAVSAAAGDAARAIDYRNLAYRQLEWIMGANPFAACMMTGEGMRNPYPHSRFVGLIPGGIMNGIAGNPEDQPILDQEYGMDWRTCEYWSPHVAYYIAALGVLDA